MPEARLSLTPAGRTSIIGGEQTGRDRRALAGFGTVRSDPIPDHLPSVDPANRPTKESGLSCSPWSNL